MDILTRLKALGDKVKQRPWHPDVVALVNDLPEIIRAFEIEHEANIGLADRNVRLRAEMDEAVRVIKPFAETPYADADRVPYPDDGSVMDGVTLGDLRAARTFLSRSKADQ